MTVFSSKRYSGYGFPLLSGLFLALSFPSPGLFPLAWIAFIPLFFTIKDQSPGKAFLSGWLAGIVYFGGTLYWVGMSLISHGGLRWLISSIVFFVLISYLASYVGFFCMLLQYGVGDEKRSGIFFAPALWVVLEWGKGRFLSGFPWASLAYSQTEFLSIIQIADFGGIYGVGFVMMLCNRALYLGFRGALGQYKQASAIQWRPLVVAFSVFLFSFFYGVFRLSETSGIQSQMRVAVIQGNIAQDQKWDRDFRKHTIENYERLSTEALLEEVEKPDLIVWPEAVLPFIFGTEAMEEQGLRHFAQEKDVHLLVGAPSMAVPSPGKVSLRNSAYLISPDTDQISQYDKLHLVPFGEYVPFPEFLFFIEKFVEGLADFTPGRDAVVFQVDEAQVGTVICFELIFPEVVRRFVQNGAMLMSTMTNDAWFGRTSAPYQHFSMMTFRAIEHRIPFARAANTGISGFIDSRGNVIQQTRLFTEAHTSATLPLRQGMTLYTRFGDFFVVFCAIISLSFLCRTLINRRKQDAR